MLMITAAGTVGRDSELRTLQNGDAVLSFSMAIDNGKDRNGVKKDSTWVRCSIWGKRAESLEPYIKKGTKIACTGRPSVSVYNDKGSLELNVDNFTFMGGSADRSDGQRNNGYDQSPERNNGPQHQADPLDDEIPF